MIHLDAPSVIVALAIVTHAWTARIVAPPRVLSVIGWVLNVLTCLALLRVCL